MKKIMALATLLSLALPNPAFALRPGQLETVRQRSGLEESLRPPLTVGLEEGVIPSDVRTSLAQVWTQWAPAKPLSNQSKGFTAAAQTLMQQGFHFFDTRFPRGREPRIPHCDLMLDGYLALDPTQRQAVQYEVEEMLTEGGGGSEKRPLRILENVATYVPAGRSLLLYNPNGSQLIAIDRGPGILNGLDGRPDSHGAVEPGRSLSGEGAGEGLSLALQWAFLGGMEVWTNGYRAWFQKGQQSPVTPLTDSGAPPTGTLVYLRRVPALAGLEERAGDPHPWDTLWDFKAYLEKRQADPLEDIIRDLSAEAGLNPDDLYSGSALRLYLGRFRGALLGSTDSYRALHKVQRVLKNHLSPNPLLAMETALQELGTRFFERTRVKNYYIFQPFDARTVQQLRQSKRPVWFFGSFLEGFPDLQSDVDLMFQWDLSPEDSPLAALGVPLTGDPTPNISAVGNLRTDRREFKAIEPLSKNPALRITADQLFTLSPDGEEWGLNGPLLAKLFRDNQRIRDELREESARSQSTVSEDELAVRAAELQMEKLAATGLEESGPGEHWESGILEALAAGYGIPREQLEERLQTGDLLAFRWAEDRSMIKAVAGLYAKVLGVDPDSYWSAEEPLVDSLGMWQGPAAIESMPELLESAWNRALEAATLSEFYDRMGEFEDAVREHVTPEDTDSPDDQWRLMLNSLVEGGYDARQRDVLQTVAREMVAYFRFPPGTSQDRIEPFVRDLLDSTAEVSLAATFRRLQNTIQFDEWESLLHRQAYLGQLEDLLNEGMMSGAYMFVGPNVPLRIGLSSSLQGGLARFASLAAHEYFHALIWGMEQEAAPGAVSRWYRTPDSGSVPSDRISAAAEILTAIEFARRLREEVPWPSAPVSGIGPALSQSLYEEGVRLSRQATAQWIPALEALEVLPLPAERHAQGYLIGGIVQGLAEQVAAKVPNASVYEQAIRFLGYYARRPFTVRHQVAQWAMRWIGVPFLRRAPGGTGLLLWNDRNAAYDELLPAARSFRRAHGLSAEAAGMEESHRYTEMVREGMGEKTTREDTDRFFYRMRLLGYRSNPQVADTLFARGYTGAERKGHRRPLRARLDTSTVSLWRNYKRTLPREALTVLEKIYREQASAYFFEQMAARGHWSNREVVRALQPQWLGELSEATVQSWRSGLLDLPYEALEILEKLKEVVGNPAAAGLEEGELILRHRFDAAEDLLEASAQYSRFKTDVLIPAWDAKDEVMRRRFVASGAASPDVAPFFEVGLREAFFNLMEHGKGGTVEIYRLPPKGIVQRILFRLVDEGPGISDPNVLLAQSDQAHKSIAVEGRQVGWKNIATSASQVILESSGKRWEFRRGRSLQAGFEFTGEIPAAQGTVLTLIYEFPSFQAGMEENDSYGHVSGPNPAKGLAEFVARTGLGHAAYYDAGGVVFQFYGPNGDENFVDLGVKMNRIALLEWLEIIGKDPASKEPVADLPVWASQLQVELDRMGIPADKREWFVIYRAVQHPGNPEGSRVMLQVRFELFDPAALRNQPPDPTQTETRLEYFRRLLYLYFPLAKQESAKLHFEIAGKGILRLPSRLTPEEFSQSGRAFLASLRQRWGGWLLDQPAAQHFVPVSTALKDGARIVTFELRVIPDLLVKEKPIMKRILFTPGVLEGRSAPPLWPLFMQAHQLLTPEEKQRLVLDMDDVLLAAQLREAGYRTYTRLTDLRLAVSQASTTLYMTKDEWLLRGELPQVTETIILDHANFHQVLTQLLIHLGYVPLGPEELEILSLELHSAA